MALPESNRRGHDIQQYHGWAAEETVKTSARVLVVGSLVCIPVLMVHGGGIGLALPRDLSWPEPVSRRTALDEWVPPPPFTASTPRRPRRWWIVCWDGASWDFIVPLLREGRLPHLAALIQNGSAGNLLTIRPTLSPVVWTTIATGMPPDRHGIVDFVRRDHLPAALSRLSPAERQRLHFYSNADRRVRAVWNIMSDAGHPVLAVGYHNTYPAERINGVMVSSYLVRRQTLEDVAGDVSGSGALAYPVGLGSDVAQAPDSPLTYDDLRAFADVSHEEFDELMAQSARPGTDRPSAQRWRFLCRALRNDRFHARLAASFLPRVRPDLLLVHFQGVDWASHEFLSFHREGRRVGDPHGRGGIRRYGATVSAFYEYLDQWLGRLLDLRDADTVVAVLSDHGFSRILDEDGRGQHADAPPGIVVLEGPGIRKGYRIPRATVYDVLPTIAAGQGLPVSREWPGDVLTEVFDREGGGFSYTRIASYEAPKRFQADVALPAGLDSELMDDLRALGYVH